MAPFVGKLSDKDIANLAAYYAGLPRGTAANGDASMVATGENLSAYCKACHGMQGVPAANVWPVIAGQQSVYLQKQLAAYKNGSRASAQMSTVVAPFGDDEFKALARTTSVPTPTMDRLSTYIDPAVPPLSEGSAQISPSWRRV